VLTAKYLDGESVENIANRERSTVTAVRSRLARARQAFRQLLLRSTDFAADKGQS
jgi:RNA polymerase sigma-70 factor (ECF subfamily)